MWDNAENTARTLIWRKTNQNTYFEKIAQLEAGVSTYIDTDTLVSSAYTYRIGAVVSEKDFTRPDFPYNGVKGEVVSTLYHYNTWGDTQSQATADYERTMMISQSNEVDGKSVGGTIKVYRNVTLDAAGNVSDQGVSYAGASVRLSLGGDNVYSSVDPASTVNGESTVRNMPDDLGEKTADENGELTYAFSVPYGGDYTVYAVIEPLENPDDPLAGFDGCRMQESFIVEFPEVKTGAPYLSTMTDAILPGDSVTITGNNIGIDGDTKIAYAPQRPGVIKPVFDDKISGLKYLSEKQISYIDSADNVGVMFTFPAAEKPGVYDFWIKNAKGWSNCITMNAARPLYLNQEASYAGLPLEIVGRNFFGSEYGLAEDTVNSIYIKLERVGDVDGNTDGVQVTRFVKIDQGVRYEVKDGEIAPGDVAHHNYSATGIEVQESNPFRLSFTTPEVGAGTYRVTVAADGMTFYDLDCPQTLLIYDRKAPVYRTDIFGAYDTHIGNDPLDLRVYWAQDLVYDRLVIVDAKYKKSTDYTEVELETNYADVLALGKSTRAYIQTQLNYLGDRGGGVLYFPDGYYWTTGSIILPSNVMMVGQSVQNTVLKLVFQDKAVANVGVFFDCRGGSNQGFSRLTLTAWDMNCALSWLPDYGISMLQATTDPGRNDRYARTENKFISEIDYVMPCPEKAVGDVEITNRNRAMLYFGGKKNFVAQNVYAYGWASRLMCSTAAYITWRNVEMYTVTAHPYFGNKYAFIENNALYVLYEVGHGFTGKSEAYVSNNYVDGPGDLNNGEVIMFEPPGAVGAKGNILEATADTFTVDYKGGDYMHSNTPNFYNYFAVYIFGGTGTGQMRYFEPDPIENDAGEIWGNSYRLCDYEDTWDIIPDHTSQFTILLPMSGCTVYQNKANDCYGGISLYMRMFDTVCVGNDLQNTSGINVLGSNRAECNNVSSLIRIEKNRVSGIGHGVTQADKVLYMGMAGILVDAQAASGQSGLTTIAVTVRNNTIRDIPPNDQHSAKGAIYVSAGGAGASSGCGKFIIISGNKIDNIASNGLVVDRNYMGIILENNTITAVGKEAIVSKGSQGVSVSAYIELIVDGKTDNGLSGMYKEGALLPVLSEERDKAFWGWAVSQNVDPAQSPITSSPSINAKMYAIFGYEITLDWNYDDRGEFRSSVLLGSAAIAGALGNPVRVDYTFGGWYYDAACTNAVSAEDTVRTRTTLYAKWTAKAAAGEDEQDMGQNDEPSGCGSDVSAAGSYAVGMLMLCAASACLFVKRKRKQ
jgi:uncharacterized repeat protein (TIGR02543 family)